MKIFSRSCTTRYTIAIITILILFHLSCFVNARQNLYKTLGVSKDAAQNDIKKAYRKMALKLHPDKVPESEREESEKRFKDVGYAHDVLTDEEKRKRYDAYGEKGLDNSFQPGFSNTNSGGSSFGGGNGFSRQPFSFGGSQQGRSNVGIDLSDILRQFNGGPSGFGGRKTGGAHFVDPRCSSSDQQQLKPRTKEFYCTLGELSDFSGCTKKLKVNMPSIDPMTGQQQNVEKIYTIEVQPGWKEGTKVRFKASKDGMFPPMIFFLKERKHKYIQRRGDDLVFKCTVSDRQAEKGAKLKIPLPDGTVLEVKTEPDEIYENYEKRIIGKGMPVRGSQIEVNKRIGDFLIEFRIREQSTTTHQ